jgi:LPS-assembly protein
MRFARLSLAALLLPLCAWAQAPTDGLLEAVSSNINIEGLETSFDPETGVATATGDVHIKYGDTEIHCARADYNANTGDVFAKEDVTIVKAGVTYKGENIVYNVKTSQLHGSVIRSGMQQQGGSLYYTMDSFKTETKFVEKIEGTGAEFTTHDSTNPNYHVKAKSMTIYPDDRVVMKNVTVYAGKTPIFWLPYMSQPLDDELGYSFTPGYSSNWGAFLLNQYGVIHGDHTLAKYKLDLRSTRGVGVGADFISLKQKDNRNWGQLKFYYANDSDPLVNHANEDRTNLDSNRYKINFQHRIYITGPAKSTWYLDFDINKLSDEFFYEDFFLEEFRTQREPDNLISLIHSDPRYTASLMAKFQMNDFYRTDTRLPELAFDFTRQPIMKTGLFYQGDTSYGLLRELKSSVETAETNNLIKQGEDFLATEETIFGKNAAPGTKLNPSGIRRSIGLDPEADIGRDDVERALIALNGKLGDFGYDRFHTYHEVLMPKTLGGWLTVVPRIGVGFNSYSSIEGGAKDLSSADQTIFHAGLDMSFKFSKTWDDVQNAKLGLNGLKHTVQPYINYSYMSADPIEGLPTIDRLVPTTRPRPIDVPFFTAVDDLRNWNIARIGVRNLLQTKRDYTSYDNWRYRSANDNAIQTYSWAGLNTYMDAFMEDPEFDRSTSNLYNELFFRPTPWLTFHADTQLPIGGGDGSFTEANYGVTFLPTHSISLTLGHQYIADHPFFENSSLIYSRVYARLNDDWGFSMNHVYESADNVMEYQSYSISRDLTSWVMTLGALVRDNRGVTDMGVIFSMTLKDFPQVSLPLDIGPDPAGRGYVH